MAHDRHDRAPPPGRWRSPVEVSGMNRGTAPAHVQAVLAIDDRVLRNYWVTQTYSDLAAGPESIARTGHSQLVHVRHLGLGYGRAEHSWGGPAQMAP